MTMKTSIPFKILLLVSGLIAIGIGGAILFDPASFFMTYGIELGNDASLFNEIRAPGGTLLALGLLMLAGLFSAEFRFTSITIAAAVYLTYGLSRLLSIAIDGWPDGGLVGAAAFELLIGAASLLALMRYRNTVQRCESRKANAADMQSRLAK